MKHIKSMTIMVKMMMMMTFSLIHMRVLKAGLMPLDGGPLMGAGLRMMIIMITITTMRTVITTRTVITMITRVMMITIITIIKMITMIRLSEKWKPGLCLIGIAYRRGATDGGQAN